MKTTRRSVIRTTSAFGALAALPGYSLARDIAATPLDIPILGGTGFVGPMRAARTNWIVSADAHY